MSFGKLNILQHKKWNVWNRDNIEKVLKDERELAEKEEKQRKHTSKVTSEQRTELLRSRRQTKSLEDGEPHKGQLVCVEDKLALTGPKETGEVTKYKGFDLFEGMNALAATIAGNESATTVGTNKETEKEKRKEKEKEDRKWGLVGLGQDSFTGTSDGQKPWYAAAQDPKSISYEGIGQAAAAHGTAPFGIPSDPDSKRSREEKRKRSADPAHDIDRYLSEKKKAKAFNGDGRSRDRPSAASSAVDEEEKRRQLERMRSERLIREAAERRRVQEIMGLAAPPRPAPAHRVPDDDPRSGYSSGFAHFHGGAIRRR